MWFRCGSCKYRHPKNICLNETGLHPQNLLTIFKVNSQCNWVNLDDALIGKRIFSLIMNKIFI